VEILHLQDGRFNHAPRLAEDVSDWSTRLVYATQLGTNSNTQQVAAGVRQDPNIWSFGDVTSNVASKEFPDVAVTENGVAHVVWRESLGGEAWQIFYANDAGGSWSAPRQITFDAFVKGVPRIDVAADTVFVHVAYSTLEPGSADEIYYLRYDTLADASVVVPVTSDAVTDDDVSIDVGDGVHLVWISGGSEGALRYAEGDTGGFTEIPTGVAAGAAQADLAVSGEVYLAYRHSVSASVKLIRFIRRDGAGFTAPLDASPGDAFYTEPSVVAGATLMGTSPAIAFCSNTTGKRGLYMAIWDHLVSAFTSPETVHADETVTYNGTDLVARCCGIGIGEPTYTWYGFAVTSTEYVEADTVRADLRAFSVLVAAAPHGNDAPVLSAASAVALAASPNPFADGTTIAFTLREPADRVLLEVLDVAGRRVVSLLDVPRPAGTHQVSWRTGRVPAGVYFLRLESDGVVATRAIHHVR
jgi:hypothetical protein